MTDSLDRQLEELLVLDPGAEVEQITGWMRSVLRHDLHKRGLVIGISGGIDSALDLSCQPITSWPVAVCNHSKLITPRDGSKSSSLRCRFPGSAWAAARPYSTPFLGSSRCTRKRHARTDPGTILSGWL